ncbi:hypothetical protein P7K49_027779 [Saguinus oedipus]|uniref:Uncharacterized protein n=1 Tax=Saguinus oedipus TaxID=9490 RepID=A0ABQ9UAX8_SAGOE|nr:hypothetical protein P7K49_027779 [Saguinus oedipus]
MAPRLCAVLRGHALLSCISAAEFVGVFPILQLYKDIPVCRHISSHFTLFPRVDVQEYTCSFNNRGGCGETVAQVLRGENMLVDLGLPFLTAVSYTNYKKTPPPVPPRTTSKPLISVTAQSSTESTQDAYQDSRAQRMSPWPQDGRGLYNSTDSLDSNKAMNLALETAAAQRHMADGQSGSARTSDKAILVSKAEELLKSRCSSIGIQVAARGRSLGPGSSQCCRWHRKSPISASSPGSPLAVTATLSQATEPESEAVRSRCGPASTASRRETPEATRTPVQG